MSVLAAAIVAFWASTVASGWTFSMLATSSPFLTLSPFFDVEVGDAAEGGGADVDVGLRLDLAGAADGGDQVLANSLAGDHFGVSGLGADDGEGNNGGDGKNDDNDDKNLLQAHIPMGGFASNHLWGELRETGTNGSG